MNDPHSYRLRQKTVTSSGLICLIGFAFTYLLFFPASPKSFAARTTGASGTNSLQETPTVSFVAPYRQTTLVSNLPGVALVEDKFLVEPRGIALSATSPFWVVDNNTDRANLYQGDVSGSPLVSNS